MKTYTCDRCGTASSSKSLPAGWLKSDYDGPNATDRHTVLCVECVGLQAAAGVVEWNRKVEHEVVS